MDRVAGGEKNRELFKKLENSEIWEFRTLHNGIAYRLFAFWDTDAQTLVVATHGIIKKTQKTPKKEIARAETITNHQRFSGKQGTLCGKQGTLCGKQGTHFLCIILIYKKLCHF